MAKPKAYAAIDGPQRTPADQQRRDASGIVSSVKFRELAAKP